MLAGQLLFAGLAVYLRKSLRFTENNMNLDHVIAIILLIVMALGLWWGNFLFKNRLHNLRNVPSLAEKLADYKAAIMIRFAWLEAPALFAIVAYLITGDKLFMGMAVSIILFFVSLKPNRENVKADLALNQGEKLELKKESQVI